MVRSSAAEPDQTTIVAPASGFGRAAVSVVRISGPGTARVVVSIAGNLPEPRRLSLRSLRHPTTSELLDRGLVAWMPAPGSFTGEDMAELHLHGGSAVRRAILTALMVDPKCRLAEPGEFSKRAFLNGRLDLTEAEGIADLVDAETDEQRRQALRQLGGRLGQQVAAWRTKAIALLAKAEAVLDFADEGDVDAAGLSSGFEAAAGELHASISCVLRDDRRGERLRDGFVVVLAGVPNSGKSTLLNVLAGRDAAIVSERPGTTRDAIEVRCDLGGLPVILVDTAGLREASDEIEAAGIARARRYIDEADLVLNLIPPDATDAGLELTLPSDRTCVVRTKADLITKRIGEGELIVSSLTGFGLDELFAAIQTKAEAALGGEASLVTRARHRDALERACSHLGRVADESNRSTELAAEDIRLAVRALGEVSGRVGVEAMLDRLFSDFCIGK